MDKMFLDFISIECWIWYSEGRKSSGGYAWAHPGCFFGKGFSNYDLFVIN